jgi:hypothetical protein
MHRATMVVTEERPVEPVLSAALIPFHDIKFDWCALGGRYSGGLIAFEGAETLTRAEMAPVEDLLLKMAEEIGVELHIPRASGPGVDAVRKKDFRGWYIQELPRALVLRRKWHEAPPSPIHETVSMMRFLKGRGIACRDPDEFMSSVREEKVLAEQALRDKWNTTFLDLLDAVGDDEWLSIVDCHY